MKIFNENNRRVPESCERKERQLAKQYIEPNDVVLELGARYGSVSCVINSKLKNKSNQVSVEPDERAWDTLESNKNNNKCHFHIVRGFISKKKLGLTNLNSWNGYGTTFTDNENSIIPSFTLEEIQEKYNLKFNTLVADCEGCLERFFEENLNFLNNLRLIIFEADYPKQNKAWEKRTGYKGKCDYSKIKKVLVEKGFKCAKDGPWNFVFVNKA